MENKKQPDKDLTIIPIDADSLFEGVREKKIKEKEKERDEKVNELEDDLNNKEPKNQKHDTNQSE